MIEKLTKSEEKKIFDLFPELKKHVGKMGFVDTPDGIGILKELRKHDGMLNATISLGVFDSGFYKVFLSKKSNDFCFGFFSQKENVWKIGKETYTSNEFERLFQHIRVQGE